MLNVEHHFASSVHWIHKPELLYTISDVFEEYVSISRKKYPQTNKIYPVQQSDNFAHDQRVQSLIKVISETSWNILNNQGYNMDMFSTHVTDMWAQEHSTYSSHDQHVHGYGSQISGFYFIDTPKDCSSIMVYDPRVSKQLIDLPERDMRQLTFATPKIHFNPQPGSLYFMNSWLPHGFTRNASELPLKLIHFNVGVNFVGLRQPANVEII